MNKERLRQSIIEQLERELNTALNASQQAHESATHEESQAENKYDTRGLEAAYLAHGLSVRAEELQQSIIAWRSLRLDEGSEVQHISIGALVVLENDSGNERVLFIGPASGGLRLEREGTEVTVVTPDSPLGNALLGRQSDDEVSLVINGVRSSYDVCRFS